MTHTRPRAGVAAPNRSMKLPPAPPIDESELPRVFVLLRAHTGVDFTHYKVPTLRRRLQRRMIHNRVPSFGSYVALLERDPVEVRALYRDILIPVTRFFRDPPSFRALAEVALPRITRHRSRTEPIRIWVPGCSTGEEPYSVLIELLEHFGSTVPAPATRMFATDVNEEAVEIARAGVYAESIAADVPPDRLRRYFTRAGSRWRIARGVRDVCVFARQDVTRDPPFSRLDLIVCRNLMIYLDRPLQRALLHTLHYALEPGGFLMLGRAETVGRATELFAPVADRQRLYVKRVAAAPPAAGTRCARAVR